MNGLGQVFDPDSPIPAYLKAVASVHRKVLGDELVALYLHGSVVQGDFRPGFSDLDILGVVSGAINEVGREQLLAKLGQDSAPVPAYGLELILCTANAVREPVAAMPFEFALSTGRDWGTQVETSSTTSDILVNMQLCRQAGLTLAGAPASNVFAPIPIGAFRSALRDELLWHRNDLRESPTNKGIVNAILNASRSLYAAKTGRVVSKTEGGNWWLEQKPEDQIVAQAIAYRQTSKGSVPVLRSAQRFLEHAISELTA